MHAAIGEGIEVAVAMREDDPAEGPFRCKAVELFLVLDVLIALANDLPLRSSSLFELLDALHYDLEED